MGEESSTAVSAWFFAVMIWVVMVMIFGIPIVLNDIIVMIQSGFSTYASGLPVCISCGFFIILTNLVPPLRMCYFKFPWLYPLCSTLFMDLFILSVAEEIMSKGYEVLSKPRHIMTIVLMILQLIVCRFLMCAYYKKKSLTTGKVKQV